MNYKLLLDTAVTAGELMLENGAETYRVEGHHAPDALPFPASRPRRSS